MQTTACVALTLKWVRVCGVLAVVGLIAPTVILGQSSQNRPPNTYRGGGPAPTAPVDAPQVHADRTVTFRLRAPEASKVDLRVEGQDPKPMIGTADGLWSITVGPWPPDIYRYHFVVGGVRVIDMSNQSVDIGRSVHYSIVEVPGAPARFDEWQDVPHGTLQVREYASKLLQSRRRLVVYLPPQYDSEPGSRFPVLYLRHGNGSMEGSWAATGRAGVILENLIAKGKAVPMVIVMPNGYPSSHADGSGEAGVEATGKELMQEIVPLIERQYRVKPGREYRGIAGLSMGGGQAFLTGLRNLDTFAWVGEFSSGAVSEADFRLEQAVPGLLSDPVATNTRLRLLFLSCGSEDARYLGHLDLVDKLKKYGIRHEWYSTPGNHEWKVWRHSLAELLQKLFQPEKA